MNEDPLIQTKIVEEEPAELQGANLNRAMKIDHMRAKLNNLLNIQVYLLLKSTPGRAFQPQFPAYTVFFKLTHRIYESYIEKA